MVYMSVLCFCATLFAKDSAWAGGDGRAGGWEEEEGMVYLPFCSGSPSETSLASRVCLPALSFSMSAVFALLMFFWEEGRVLENLTQLFYMLPTRLIGRKNRHTRCCPWWFVIHGATSLQ